MSEVRLAGLAELRFDDIATFLAIRRSESISGAARALHVTPSHVSKAVRRLERQLGTRMLARGARGVTLTVAAERLAPQFDDILHRVVGLRSPDLASELTVAAPSFLNWLFLPEIAKSLPSYRVRGVELPPALVRFYAAENFFDLALTIGEAHFPDTWESSRIGVITKGLYASPALARRFGRSPISSSQLVAIPFIVPIYMHNGRFVVADEGCPLAHRRIGHEVQTIALGLQLAARTNQLVFSPKIVARPYVERGELVEISVKGWDVSEDLFVACNGERMFARARDAAVAALRAQLSTLAD
jgi:DNA-binding transcriptional LysR family regulator